MKAEELKTKSEDELKKLLLDTRKEQFNLRFQRSNGALDNTAQMRAARRTVARIKTFLNASEEQKAVNAPKKAAAKKPAAKKKTTKKADKAA